MKDEIIDLPKISDPRGNLTFIESNKHIPFEIKRFYYLYDVRVVKQEVDMLNLQQLLIAVSRSFDVVVDDGYEKRRYHLNRSYYGLYMPTMTWREWIIFPPILFVLY